MIADALEALFARCALLTELPLAWPERGFSPPEDGKYLRVDISLNSPFWEGVASGRVDQGLLQATVIWPKGLGLIAPCAKADEVIAHFHQGLRMRAGAATVKVAGAAYAMSPLTESGQVEVPVIIPWTAV